MLLFITQNNISYFKHEKFLYAYDNTNKKEALVKLQGYTNEFNQETIRLINYLKLNYISEDCLKYEQCLKIVTQTSMSFPENDILTLNTKLQLVNNYNLELAIQKMINDKVLKVDDILITNHCYSTKGNLWVSDTNNKEKLIKVDELLEFVCQKLNDYYNITNNILFEQLNHNIHKKTVNVLSYSIEMYSSENDYIVFDGNSKISLDNLLHWMLLNVPRFDFNTLAKKPSGYHVTDIKKGVLGSSSKIQEELDELIDAELQKNKILALNELSDIIGAIDAYLSQNFSEISLNDLIKMSNATKSAFSQGVRK